MRPTGIGTRTSPDSEKALGRLDRVFKLISSLKPEAIRDTIFSRSPVFYSLVLVLDSLRPLPTRPSLERTLGDIDARFNDPRPPAERPEEDLAFVGACTASTQRIRARQTRFEYIRSFL